MRFPDPLARHGPASIAARERSSSVPHSLVAPSPSPVPLDGAGPSSAAAGPSRTPYRPGFQPKGVSRSQTEAFVRARLGREERREGRRGEERRLGRRLEKLIALHFTPPSVAARSRERESTGGQQPQSAPSKNGRRPGGLKDVRRRESSLVEELLVEGRSPRDVWKTFKERSFSGTSPGGQSQDGNGKAKMTVDQKRAVEQAIVKWEDDATAKQCTICETAFSFLMRRHHCRLCGLTTCALPPTPAHLIPLTANPRPESCSVLFVADWRDSRCELVHEGFKGFLKIGGMGVGGSGAKDEEEMEVDGVRACRRCWEVVEKKQYMLDAARVPAFTRMYDALTTIQAEIEELIPEHRDLIRASQADDATAEDEKATAELRRTLLESFATYDALAKRIRGLPCPKGSSQERLQIGIGVRAGGWLAKEMSAVEKSLTRQKKKHAKNASLSPSSVAAAPSDDGSSTHRAESDLAMQIQPLLEQEAQLESFIKEAEARKKFEDAQSLQLSLEEIRREIARIASGAMD